MLPIVAIPDKVIKAAEVVIAVGTAYCVVDECIERIEKRKSKSEKKRRKAIKKGSIKAARGIA